MPQAPSRPNQSCPVYLSCPQDGHRGAWRGGSHGTQKSGIRKEGTGARDTAGGDVAVVGAEKGLPPGAAGVRGTDTDSGRPHKATVMLGASAVILSSERKDPRGCRGDLFFPSRACDSRQGHRGACPGRRRLEALTPSQPERGRHRQRAAQGLWPSAGQGRLLHGSLSPGSARTYSHWRDSRLGLMSHRAGGGVALGRQM